MGVAIEITAIIETVRGNPKLSGHLWKVNNDPEHG
jgi:hypothetical protein